MLTSLQDWARAFWEDLQPTPGRMDATLRIVLASVITLILLLVLQVPFASVSLYFVFIVGRESPSVSLRSGIFSSIVLIASVATELGVIILTDNDPLVRLVSVSVVTFIAGVFMVASRLPALASTWGFIYCTLIALWEGHGPANAYVKTSLWLLAATGIATGSSIAVEYLFALRNPAELLREQRRIRYKALEALFGLYAQGADEAQIKAATMPVLRLAAAGQTGMARLYNAIVDRKLDPGALPMGLRSRIAMLAQLMDLSAAFAAQHPTLEDSEKRRRCAIIAQRCHAIIENHLIDTRDIPPSKTENLSLLDRVEEAINTIQSMPTQGGSDADTRLIALPASQASLIVPGAIRSREAVTFGLKISFCATLCYIVYHALDWSGIATSVTTVLIVGITNTGAIKQKFLFRLLGAILGGLILGIGSTAFLFPYMDSITSLTVLVACVAFIAAWCSTGRRFSYIGLQVAFAFYLVAFEGSSAPTQLAPARDRLVGIFLALVIMWFVFDQLWPVRTVTVMRNTLAALLHNCARLFRLSEDDRRSGNLFTLADSLRDQSSRTVTDLRVLNDAVPYEFGVDRDLHIHSGNRLVTAAITAIALFWNQLAVLHRDKESERDFLTEPALVNMRQRFAERLDKLAAAVAAQQHIPAVPSSSLVDPAILASPRYGEYARNALARFSELQELLSGLSTRI